MTGMIMTIVSLLSLIPSFAKSLIGNF